MHSCTGGEGEIVAVAVSVFTTAAVLHWYHSSIIVELTAHRLLVSKKQKNNYEKSFKSYRSNENLKTITNYSNI